MAYNAQIKKVFALGVLLTVTFLQVSCERASTIKIPDISDMDVYDRRGRVHDYSYREESNKVIQQIWASCLCNNVLPHTPSGKIDRIIAENPDWEFLFFVYVKNDSTEIDRLLRCLDKYDCDFPVILDYDRTFSKINHQNYTEIGYICDSKNHLLGVSVIGTEQSFFDQEFSRAKKQLRYRYSNQ